MFSVKKFKNVSIVFFILIALSFNVSLAQNNSKKSISVVFPFLSDIDAPGNIVSKKLKELFSLNGIQIDNLAQFAVIVIPAEIPESEKIIITYLFANSLPDEIMNFNKENETAYIKVANKQDLSKEGKVIREYLTQEKLTDYRKINYSTYSNTIITDKSKLKTDLNIIIEQVKSNKTRNN